MSINQRVIEFFESKKIPAPDFYRKIGVNRIEWSKWVNDFKPITVKHLQSIISAYNELNARWLMTGEGEMMINEKQPVEYLNQTNLPEIVEDYGCCKLCNEKEKRIADKEEIIKGLNKHIELLEFTLGKSRSTGSE